MHIGPTLIVDTFAEAFDMRFARLTVTAIDAGWVATAVDSFCGCATSIIGCDVEAGLERLIEANHTLDGRPGAHILAFGLSTDRLTTAVQRRTSQCLLTCATTAVYDGLPDGDKRLPLGSHLRFFGDGYQKSKLVSDRRFWRIPVMDGECVIEESVGSARGIAGANLIIEGDSIEVTLAAARRAVAAIAPLPGVITPFPGGVARSGSKVGSRYKSLRASTNDSFCPTLRGRTPSLLQSKTQAALEIVMNGVDRAALVAAMGAAAQAAAGDGVVAINAGNYGGTLGPHHLPLREICGRGFGP